MTMLLPCDILLVRHKGAFLSGAIRWFESIGDDNKPAIASHTGLITRAGEGLDAWVTEALTKVVEHPMSAEYGNSKDEFAVFRPLNLSDDQRASIVARANSFVGDGYGYAKLLAHLGDDLIFGGANIFRHLCRIDDRPICSYVVGAAFAAEGLNFGVPYRALDPDDIWDFCWGNPDKYQFITQRGSMYPERLSCSKS